MKLSIETCVTALNSAAMNRRAAVQLELTVGLAVFHAHGGAGKEARQALNEAYAAAGYRCLQATEMDYKTINRRINAAADLYENLPVAKWAGKHGEDAMLQSIHTGLVPYEFFTIADVLRFCTPPAKEGAPVKAQPHQTILSPSSNPGTTGQDKVIAQFRRAADQVAHGARHVETPHLAITIPKDTSPEEMIEMAMKLLELAKAKDLLTA